AFAGRPVALGAVFVVNGLAAGLRLEARAGERNNRCNRERGCPPCKRGGRCHSFHGAIPLQTINTILPRAPGSMTAACALAASASGISRPTTGLSVPADRPAMNAP